MVNSKSILVFRNYNDMCRPHNESVTKAVVWPLGYIFCLGWGVPGGSVVISTVSYDCIQVVLRFDITEHIWAMVAMCCASAVLWITKPCIILSLISKHCLGLHEVTRYGILMMWPKGCLLIDRGFMWEVYWLFSFFYIKMGSDAHLWTKWIQSVRSPWICAE